MSRSIDENQTRIEAAVTTRCGPDAGNSRALGGQG